MSFPKIIPCNIDNWSHFRENAGASANGFQDDRAHKWDDRPTITDRFEHSKREFDSNEIDDQQNQ
jgi:hypothetical protein